MKLSEREQYNIKIPPEYGKSRPKGYFIKNEVPESRFASWARFYLFIYFFYFGKK